MTLGQKTEIYVLSLTAKPSALALAGCVTGRLRWKLLRNTGNHSESTSLPVMPGVSVKIVYRMPLMEWLEEGSQQLGKRGHSWKKGRRQVKITVLTLVSGNK
jgi:hypothetical protein